MNLKQAARRLGVHYQTAYRWVRAGRLAAVRVGNGYDVSEYAIEQLLAENDAMRRPQTDVPAPAEPVVETVSPEALVRAANAAYNAMNLSPGAVFEVVSDGLARLLGDLVILRVVADDRVLVARSVHHIDPQRLSIAWTGIETFEQSMSQPHEEVAIATCRPVLIRHLPQDQLRAHTPPELIQFFDDARPHSLLCVPACHAGAPRAVVTLSREFPSRPYAPEDVGVVMELATIVGAAVVRAAAAQEAWRRRRDLMTSLAEIETAVDELGAVAHLVADGVTAELICTMEGRIICANSAAGELGAIASEKLIGRSLSELAVAEEQDSEQELLGRLAVGELTFADADRTVVTDDGSRLRLAVHRGVVCNAGAKPTALVVIASAVPEPELCTDPRSAA